MTFGIWVMENICFPSKWLHSRSKKTLVWFESLHCIVWKEFEVCSLLKSFYALIIIDIRAFSPSLTLDCCNPSHSFDWIWKRCISWCLILTIQAKKKSPPFVYLKSFILLGFYALLWEHIWTLAMCCHVVSYPSNAICSSTSSLHFIFLKKISSQHPRCRYHDLLSHTYPSTHWSLLCHSDQRKSRGAPIGIEDDFSASVQMTEVGQSIAILA